MLMKEVRIEIEDTELANLGVDQEVRYTPYRFPESKFSGYWISEKDNHIVFYVGTQTFNCKNIQKNIDIFESIK